MRLPGVGSRLGYIDTSPPTPRLPPAQGRSCLWDVWVRLNTHTSLWTAAPLARGECEAPSSAPRASSAETQPALGTARFAPPRRADGAVGAASSCRAGATTDASTSTRGLRPLRRLRPSRPLRRAAVAVVCFARPSALQISSAVAAWADCFPISSSSSTSRPPAPRPSPPLRRRPRCLFPSRLSRASALVEGARGVSKRFSRSYLHIRKRRRRAFENRKLSRQRVVLSVKRG